MTNTNYPSANEPENRTTVKKTTTTTPNNTVKNIAIGVLAAALLGTWGYFLKVKNESEDKIQLTQTTANNAMSSRDSVQLLYNDALSRLDSITGNNNDLQGQLSSNQSEITKLKNEINSIMRKRNATASELARAKSLIGTLNSKIANLEAEVARLTGENQELASANTQLSAEKQTLQTNLQTTTSEKEELAQTVDVASTFSASNIQVRAIDEKKSGKEKETTTAKKVNKLLISFDVENRVARSGPADIYVIVTAPNGQIISDPNLGSGTLTTRTEGDRPFTFKSTMQYEQGTRKNVSVPLNQSKFQTGSYKVEIYQNGFKIAEAVRNLHKGGLFG
jgi:predicted  nucleic acid-binding Zn-ribbon protein